MEGRRVVLRFTLGRRGERKGRGPRYTCRCMGRDFSLTTEGVLRIYQQDGSCMASPIATHDEMLNTRLGEEYGLGLSL